MERRRLTLFTLLSSVLLLLLFVVACTATNDLEPAANPGEQPQSGITVERPTQESGDDLTDSAPSPSPTPFEPTLIATPTAGGPINATPTPWVTPTPCAGRCPTATPWTPSPDSPTPTPVPPFPGMVYETVEGLWQLDAGWQPHLLTERPAASLSPDGQSILYLVQDDVLVESLNSGEAVNVTEGSDRRHLDAQWWPARPGTLILSSQGPQDAGPNYGRLTLVNADGSDYRLAHEAGVVSSAPPAPSPDGQTIAFDEAGNPMLYHIDGEAVPFDPHAYGLPQDVTVDRAASPAWSPDGNKLAWVMGVSGPTIETVTGSGIALGIFDLQAHSAQLLHPFEPVGRGGWFEAPSWSADGRWLAFFVESSEATDRGLWLLAADGNAEYQVSPSYAGPALWSPPGEAAWQGSQHLVFGAAEQDNATSYWLVEPQATYRLKMALPGDARLRDWPAPLPE